MELELNDRASKRRKVRRCDCFVEYLAVTEECKTVQSIFVLNKAGKLVICEFENCRRLIFENSLESLFQVVRRKGIAEQHAC